jgi:hypothetical protein
MARYRLIDTAGSEIGEAEIDQPAEEGLTVHAAGLGEFLVVELYDGDDGAQGGVAATLVVEEA